MLADHKFGLWLFARIFLPCLADNRSSDVLGNPERFGNV